MTWLFRNGEENKATHEEWKEIERSIEARVEREMAREQAARQHADRSPRHKGGDTS
jgi:hypothetical protein